MVRQLALPLPTQALRLFYESRDGPRQVTAIRDRARSKEARDIAEFEKSVEVARLMLGKLHAPMRRISERDYEHLTRKQLKSGKYSIRREEGEEARAFYRRNFKGRGLQSLAKLYDRLIDNGSQLRLALTEFIALVGEPKAGVLKDVPLHATVDINLWGMQFEYPEMHLAKDLCVACNDLLEAEEKSKEWEQRQFSELRRDRDEVAQLQRRIHFSCRSIVLGCFHLVEAYFNGLAWEYVQLNDVSELSARRRKLLDTGKTNTIEKIKKYPPIVCGREGDWLSGDSETFLIFRDIVKPFRDSIVHASPFATPEQFGGYDKLSKIYELSTETALSAMRTSLQLICDCQDYMGRQNPPDWLPVENEDGRFTTT